MSKRDSYRYHQRVKKRTGVANDLERKEEGQQQKRASTYILDPVEQRLMEMVSRKLANEQRARGNLAES